MDLNWNYLLEHSKRKSQKRVMCSIFMSFTMMWSDIIFNHIFEINVANFEIFFSLWKIDIFRSFDSLYFIWCLYFLEKTLIYHTIYLPQLSKEYHHDVFHYFHQFSEFTLKTLYVFRRKLTFLVYHAMTSLPLNFCHVSKYCLQ